MARISLPIDPLLPEIAALLRESASLVIEAPPGAGKTTRVPPALLAEPACRGEIVVLQPRRLPARLAALRVAEEMGEEVGATVGYSIRFEEIAGARTRIRFMTEGILLRRFLSDPMLKGVSVVILDEFHERHLATDLALALLRRLQTGLRPDLRLVVMSATLESEPVREFLGNCPSVQSEGRAFPVSVEYSDLPDDRFLSERIASAVRRLHQEGLEGDVLVFVPGAAEIRRATLALAPFADARNLLLLPLHGELPPAEQRRAVSPAPRPKIILSTNVAETSVTIPGVAAVVDSGLVRSASHSPWSGLPRLATIKISQASAIQRAGRAGRTRPGRAIRLYPRQDYETRRPHEVPEVGRMDLSEVLLLLAALGIGDPARFSWFEAPDAAALAAGATLLRRLGAVDGKGELTQIGRQMLRFPTHPRLARLLVEGENRGVGEESAVLAAILSEGDISDTARANLGPGRMALPGAEGADLLERVDRFFQARALRFDPARLRGLGVDARAADSVEKARRQLAGVFQKGGRAIARPTDREAVDVALAKATLMAFPDRVMQRRSPGASEAVLATGGAVEIGPLPPGDLLVAVDAEERAGAPGRKTGRAMCVRLAVAVEPEWLLDMLPEGLSETTEANWNETTLRVETVSRLAYGSVVLAETKRAAHPSADASRMLAQVVLDDRGQNQVMSDSSVIELKVKLYVLRKAFPEHDIPDLEAQDIRTIVTAACDGLTSMQELRAMPLGERLRATLTPTVERMLRSDTPDRVVLASGHQISVHYEEGKSPWIESRLQDFFGMKAGPTLCRARVPLTLHLLAPNLRAVQVTSDLAGFWHRHYPEIRRELCRRYPKHAWPEDGATATPPAPRPRQR